LSSEETKKKCPSEIYWWDDIRRLALEFKKECSNELNFDMKKFDFALEIYKRSLESYKEFTYGEKASDNRMDRHKIIAFYILSFLISKPFSVKNQENKKEAFANELFSLSILETMLPAFNEKEERLEMIDKEKLWFINLLNYLIRKKRRSDLLVISEKEEMADVLSLAQIVYYIEKSYK